MRTMQWGAHRSRDARLITTAAVLICALGGIAAMIPAVEHAIGTAFVLVGAAVGLRLALRAGTRWLRHRWEDRADAITAAAWQAEHAPHLTASARGGRAE